MLDVNVKETLSFHYPLEAKLVPIEEIELSNRAREQFGDLQDLADSIAQVGLIHPPTLDGTGILVAGERRIRAMQLLGATEIPVLFREEMSTYQRKEAELHENTHRLKMTWQERVMLIHDAHRLREHENALQGKPWYQRDTGALFNRSSASVHNALQLAELIISGDAEILAEDNITSAVQLLITRAEARAMDEQVRRHGTQMPAPPAKRVGEITIVDATTGQEISSILPSLGTQPAIEPVFQTTEFDLGSMFKLGDCLEIMRSMKPGSVDHILTDIPYGIDVEQMEIQNKETIAATHSVEANVEMMPKFLEEAYRLIGTTGGFCAFFYDLDHHEKLMTWAEEVGFEVCHWPYIWIKTHQCQNKSAQYNPTKWTEYAMICRRNGDSPTTLMKPWPKNYLQCDASAERKMYTNPFAKPAALWNDILDHIAFTGQTILDPYGGQFSSGRAMFNKGMKPIMIEIEKYHFVRGVQAMIEQINKLTSNKAVYTNNPLEDLG